MKHLLYFLFLPLSLFAQRETKTDTSYIESANGSFFSVRRVVYLNDEETYQKTLIGDTARLVQNQIERITSQAASMARDAQTVSNFKRQLAALIRESNAVLAASGVSPIDTVQKLHVLKFLSPGWTIRQSGTISDVSFIVNASGRLRYTVTGQAARNADLFGDVMILNAYPAQGSQVELYRNSEGNYMSLDRSVVVRVPGSTANLSGSTSREAAAPVLKTVEPETTPIPPPKGKKKKKSPRI